MKDRFKGEVAFFLKAKDKSGEWASIDTCDADNQWEALAKFRSYGNMTDNGQYIIMSSDGTEWLRFIEGGC